MESRTFRLLRTFRDANDLIYSPVRIARGHPKMTELASSCASTQRGRFDGLDSRAPSFPIAGQHDAHEVSAGVCGGGFERDIGAGAITGNSWPIIKFQAAVREIRRWLRPGQT